MHCKESQAIFSRLLRCAKGNLSQKRSDAMSAARLRPDVVVPVLFPFRSVLKDKSAILFEKSICVFFDRLYCVKELEIVARPFQGSNCIQNSWSAAFPCSV